MLKIHPLLETYGPTKLSSTLVLDLSEWLDVMLQIYSTSNSLFSYSFPVYSI